MAKKDNFILYTEQRAVIEKLTDEQAGKIIKAIYEYVDTGIMPELDTTLDLVITPFKTVLDKNKKKYEEVSRIRAKAGAKGGKQKKQKQTKGSKCNDNDKDKDNEYDNELIINARFEKFYEKYPKKVKKQDVKKWFEKNKPDNELFSLMLDKLEQFRGCKEWLKDNGQYIPYPTSWLNQKRWEDEIETDESDEKDREKILQEAFYNGS